MKCQWPGPSFLTCSVSQLAGPVECVCMGGHNPQGVHGAGEAKVQKTLSDLAHDTGILLEPHFCDSFLHTQP